MSRTAGPDTTASDRPLTSLETLVAQQAVSPVKDIRELVGTFWPEDESVDGFVEEIQRLRHMGESG